MNAQTSIKAAPTVRNADAHLFRSQLIEIMAQVEQAAMRIVVAAGKPVPHLPGAKLEAARQVSTGKAHAERLALLEALQSYCDLRSAICHATISRPGSSHYCFRPVADAGVKRWRPVLMAMDEMQTALTDVTKLADQLGKLAA